MAEPRRVSARRVEPHGAIVNLDPATYERLVRIVEQAGLTRSDAQGAVDVAAETVGTEVAAFEFPYATPQLDATKRAVDRVFAECGNVTTWRMYEPAEPPHTAILVVCMTERASRASLVKARRIVRLPALGGRQVDVEDLPVRDGVSLVDALRIRRLENALSGAARGEREVAHRLRMPSGFYVNPNGTVEPRRRPQG